MRQIKQRHDTDCGVACVAMLADVSYADAMRVCFPRNEKRKHFAMKTKAMRWALDAFGFYWTVGLRKYHPDIKGTLLLKTHTNGNKWHWMVRTPRGRVLDPSNYRRHNIQSCVRVLR